MGRQALYRKYRSKSLAEVVGQDHITEVLAAAIKSGVFSHAYLFTGPRGTGKTSVARIVAHLINNLDYDEQSFDIIEIDAASHGLKDDIKDLIEKARIVPSKEKYKVYIIDEVHSMKHDAFNTFLKLLEEPPEHVMFIMATTDPQKLPATILSRAQRFHFRPVEQEKVVAHLRNIAEQEKIDIDDAALGLIALRGEGSMRDSISLLDQLGGFGKKITPEIVEELLGLIPGEKIEQMIQALEGSDLAKISAILAEFRNQGISPNTVVNQLNPELIRRGHYEIVEKLLEAPKSLDPWLKILAVLGAFADNNKPAPKKTPIEIKIQAPKPVVKETAKKQPEQKIEPESKSEPKKTAPLEIDWQKIIEEMKKINEPCGAWISLASHEYDGEILTLYFKTKLQRTKMKEARCWQTLKTALTALYATPPAVVVSDGPKPKSEAVNKVADIMGGGELL